jgi:hypothetical protein
VLAARATERRLFVVCQDGEKAVLLQPCNYVCACNA